MSTSRATADTRYGCPSCRAVFRTGFARCPIDGEPLQALVADPLEGSTFADRYVIEELVGEGAMGRVYRARHQRVSRQFAIKVLFGDHTTDQKMRDRFAREAEAASRLSHPNVISVVDFGEADSLLYLVMDFVEGRELEDAIGAEAPMEPERVRPLLRQLCLGLEHAHGEGLVHRDFKPTNVILTEVSGVETPRIVDFGLAVMSEMMEADRITTEGIVFGTPAYMSPEQATGQEIDHQTDLFALGVVLYELLSGIGPFEGSPIAIARQNITAEPPPIAERVPGLEVDPVLEAIAVRLMAKKKEDRYTSAREVIDELDGAGAIVSVPAETSASETVADRAVLDDEEPTEPRRPIAGFVLGGLLALIILGGAGSMLWRTISEAGSPQAAAPALDAAPAAIDAIVVDQPDAARLAATPDAAVRDVEPDPDAAPVVRRPDNSDKLRPEPETPDKPEPETPDKPEPTVVKQATLVELYNRVNRQITRFASEHGAAAASELWAEYESVVVTDAIRNPALRAQYLKKLRRLQRRVRRASKR